jgi:NAD(P)H-dependent FMN reductase
MPKPRIGIIVSSVRKERFADKALDWLLPIARSRHDLDFEVLDLRDYSLPLFNEPKPSDKHMAENPVGRRWRQKLAELDGFVFLMAEYNRGPTAAIKNAIDWAYPEWNFKPGACIGYGSTGAARAIEQVRSNMIELQMAPVRQAVYIGGAEFVATWSDGKPIGDFSHFADETNIVFDNLEWWASLLIAGREKRAEAA